MTYEWHRRDLPWADAVVDTRELTDISRLPTVLPAPVPDRALSLDGWQATPYALPIGGPKGGSTSVLTLEAPDGWVGAIVMTQASGKAFTFGRLNDVVPYLGRLMSKRAISNERRQVLTEATLAGLPMLRDAITDPRAWDGADRPIHPPGKVGAAHAFMLAWASSGVACPLATALDRMLVRPVFSGAADTYSVLGWQAHGYTPAQVVEWFEAGVRSRLDVAALEEVGFTPHTVAEWMATPLSGLGVLTAGQSWAFVDAGWTPRALRAISVFLNEEDGPDLPSSFHQTVVEWTRFAHPTLASRLLSAGISLDVARRLHAAGDLPDAETLDMVAAIRDEPDGWPLQQPRLRGIWEDPHDRTGRPVSAQC